MFSSRPNLSEVMTLRTLGTGGFLVVLHHTIPPTINFQPVWFTAWGVPFFTPFVCYGIEKGPLAVVQGIEYAASCERRTISFETSKVRGLDDGNLFALMSAPLWLEGNLKPGEFGSQSQSWEKIWRSCVCYWFVVLLSVNCLLWVCGG